MNVTYWSNWYKRKNSTRQPTGGTTVSVVLKQPCSFWNPEIESAQIPKTANYFKIPADEFTQYDAYYFVDDVVSITNDVSRFKLTFDPMGTYKSLISASWQYVLRTNAPGSFNPMLTDELNPPSNDVKVTYASTQITYGNDINVFDLSTFRFLLSTVGAVATLDYALNNGIAKTYVMSGGQMAMLAHELCTTNFLQQLVNEFTNPMESIVRCLVLPVNLSGMSIHGSEPIFFGAHSSGVIANVLLDRVLISTVTLSIPEGMTGTVTYLNKSPYCTATIYLPFVGVCPLDLDLLAGKSLKLKTVIDCFTGDITYSIQDLLHGTIYQTFSGKCGTEVPVSALQYSAMGAVGGIMTTIGGVAAKNPVMAAAGVGATVSSFEAHAQVNGGYSSVISGWQGTNVVITCFKRDPAHTITDASANEGLPYEKREMLGNLSGYILCRNASVDIPGSGRDKDTINSYLNSGFFLE